MVISEWNKFILRT